MRTDKEIIKQTELLASKFAGLHGWGLKKGETFKDSKNIRAESFWRMACIAQEVLTDTDVENCY